MKAAVFLLWLVLDFCCILSRSSSYYDFSSFLRRRSKNDKKETVAPLVEVINDRFNYILINQKSNNRAAYHQNKETNELIVFIAITSGPHHSHLRHGIRNSWILPCIASSSCDYRFFVDSSPFFHPFLQEEQLSYGI
jgi:hypothetical protein